MSISISSEKERLLTSYRKNPALVWQFAEDLGVDINIANQIKWAFGGRGSGSKK